MRDRRRTRCTRSRDARGAGRDARPAKTYTLTFDTNVRIVHGDARPEARPQDDRVARRARAGRLLRRHDLPPRRPGLRDPGWRPDADRLRRTGLLDGRQAAVGCEVHEGRRRDGEDRRRGARDVGQPVLRRHRPRTPAFRPTTRSSARSRTEWTRSSGSRSSGSATAAVASRSSSRASPSARADGRASPRSSSPRARRRGSEARSSGFSSPPSSSGSQRRSVDEIVMVEGAYELQRRATTSRHRVVLPRLAARPGASLRCGLAALGDDVDVAVVVLADGPDLSPAAVERVLGDGARTAGSSPRRTAAHAGIRSSSAGRTGRDPRRGPARPPGATRPVRRPRRAGRRRHVCRSDLGRICSRRSRRARGARRACPSALVASARASSSARSGAGSPRSGSAAGSSHSRRDASRPRATPRR